MGSDRLAHMAIENDADGEHEPLEKAKATPAWSQWE